MESKKKSFDEWWAEEEKDMKTSLRMSKEWKKMRYGKAPAKELVDRCEGRGENGEETKRDYDSRQKK